MRTKKERPWGWPQAFLPETEKLKNVLPIQTITDLTQKCNRKKQ